MELETARLEREKTKLLHKDAGKGEKLPGIFGFNYTA